MRQWYVTRSMILTVLPLSCVGVAFRALPLNLVHANRANQTGNQHQELQQPFCQVLQAHNIAFQKG